MSRNKREESSVYIRKEKVQRDLDCGYLVEEKNEGDKGV